MFSPHFLKHLSMESMVPATQLSRFRFFPWGFSFAVIRTGVAGGGVFSAPKGGTKPMFVVLSLKVWH